MLDAAIIFIMLGRLLNGLDFDSGVDFATMLILMPILVLEFKSLVDVSDGNIFKLAGMLSLFMLVQVGGISLTQYLIPFFTREFGIIGEGRVFSSSYLEISVFFVGAIVIYGILIYKVAEGFNRKSQRLLIMTSPLSYVLIRK